MLNSRVEKVEKNFKQDRDINLFYSEIIIYTNKINYYLQLWLYNIIVNNNIYTCSLRFGEINRADVYKFRITMPYHILIYRGNCYAGIF